MGLSRVGVNRQSTTGRNINRGSQLGQGLDMWWDIHLSWDLFTQFQVEKIIHKQPIEENKSTNPTAQLTKANSQACHSNLTVVSSFLLPSLSVLKDGNLFSVQIKDSKFSHPGQHKNHK